MDWSYESDKQILISYDGGEITNADIVPENFSLTERICSSDQVEFGTCEASELRVTVSNKFGRLKGKEITVQIYNEGDSDNKFTIGKYVVTSDKIVEHGTLRELVAYDKMYELSQKDVSSWYNNFFGTGNSSSEGGTSGGVEPSYVMQRMLISLGATIGMTIPVPSGFGTLNVYRTIEAPSSLMATDILKAVGEVTGGSYHINRDGSLGFVSFINRSSRKFYVNSEISEIEYQDYTVQPITKVVIQASEDGTRYSAGTGDNAYVITGNMLFTEEGLASVGGTYAQKLQTGLKTLTYQPVEVEAVANLSYEVGSPLNIETVVGTVNTFLFLRTVNGVQGMMDRFSADGEENRETDKSLQGQIASANANAASALDKVGASYKSVVTHYLATSAGSGVTRETSGWTTTTQTVTATNKYLWTYNTYVKANGTTEEGSPVITGVYGDKGDTGAKGDKGDPGTPGAKGDTGNGISNVRTIYYTSNSSTAPSSPSRSTTGVTNNSVSSYNAWNLRVATFSSSYPYVFTCQQTLGTDGYYVYSTAVLDTFYSSKIKAGQIDTQDLFTQNIIIENNKSTGGSIAVTKNITNTTPFIDLKANYSTKMGYSFDGVQYLKVDATGITTGTVSEMADYGFRIGMDAETLGGLKIDGVDSEGGDPTPLMALNSSGVILRSGGQLRYPITGITVNNGTTVYRVESNGVANITVPSGGSSYTLPTASATVLGGIKVGSNLSISNGVLSATIPTSLPANGGTATNARFLIDGKKGAGVAELPYYAYGELGGSTDNETYIKNLLKKLVTEKRTDLNYHTLIGKAHPNSQGFCILYVYEMTDYNGTGMPRYSRGEYWALGGGRINFGTYNGTWYYNQCSDDDTWRPIGTGATDAAAGNHTHSNYGTSLVIIGTSLSLMNDSTAISTVTVPSGGSGGSYSSAWTALTITSGTSGGGGTVDVTGYATLFLKGKCNNSEAGWQTMTIPINSIETSDNYYAFTDGSQYVSFKMRRTVTSAGLTKVTISSITANQSGSISTTLYAQE